jgi:protein disulfide-isomerase A6
MIYGLRLAFAVGLCALLPFLARAAMFPADSPVVQLSKSTFKREVLDIEKPTFVAFTAPWCGHCKKLAPEYHKAAVNLDGIVKFANIDCDEDVNKGICAEYRIQGFPTLKLFPATKKRIPRDYQGERMAKPLVEYAKNSLPMGARKLAAEELQGWLDEAPWRPKVILFSDKPKSSPLYRSLALDFRKTIDFAFMRGDESLVRSSARLVLGIDMPTAATLPVLMIVPARNVSDSGDVAELQKGVFETYVGQLKYRPIKAWLEKVAPSMGAGKKVNKSVASKQSAKAKANSAGGKVSNKYADEVIPEGGAVEWKARVPLTKEQEAQVRAQEEGKKKIKQMAEEAKRKAKEADDGPIVDESAPLDGSWEDTMQEIERSGKIADQLRAEVEEAGRKTRKFAGLFNPGVKEDGSEAASGDSILDKAGNAYENVAQKVFDATTGAQAVVQDTAQKIVSAVTGEKSSPFERKSEALMKQFSKWMAGEAPQEWEEQLGDTYARAQAEAEELLRKDPEEAARQAWASEEWLLGELRKDKERMYDVMTTEQRAQVDNMIELIESRLSKKERLNPFARDEKAQFPFSQEQVSGGGDEKKKSHDEL